MPDLGKAFILGAGLGTRLRPLTEFLPKPLVPVCNRPLITYAFDHLISDLGAREFMVNTHHCPDSYGEAFPEGSYRERDIHFRHEPVLLDTAGGIDNIRDWLPTDESFAVYNGDILTDLPLKDAWAQHCASGDLVTLVLRSVGDELRVGFDPESGRVTDMRGLVDPDWQQRFQFTGIYFVSPGFLKLLKPGEIESVVLPLVEAIRKTARVGGVVVDEGEWSDLGERGAYLDALKRFDSAHGERISASADIGENVSLDALSTIGEHARIGAGAKLSESVVWSGGIVEPGAELERVVVRSGQTADGRLTDTDV